MNEAERKYLRESQEPNKKFESVKQIILNKLSERKNKSELVKCLKESVCFAENNLEGNENSDGKSVISLKEQQKFRKIFKPNMRVNTTNERRITK